MPIHSYFAFWGMQPINYIEWTLRNIFVNATKDVLTVLMIFYRGKYKIPDPKVVAFAISFVFNNSV